MLTEEDVDSWNQLFPDCQINNTNLGNPTEGFLTNALVCYLRRFGYKIEPPFDLNTEKKENNKETRSFLIKLARQIDHFLKITDKSYSFNYYDLIKPTPKKTAHMLYILLNYYYYYNLYKEDVFQMAGDKIHKLEELKDRIDKTRGGNEHRKQENINLKSTIENLMDEVPKARTKFKVLDKERSQQEDEYDKMHYSLQEHKEKFKHLEEQKKILRKRVVAKEEFQELQSQIHQIKVDLEEQTQIESINVSNLNECKQSNVNLQNLSKEVEKCHEIIPLDRIKDLKVTNDQFAQSQREVNKFKLKEKSLLKEIDEESAKLHSLEKKHQDDSLKFQTKQRALMSSISEKQNILKEKNNYVFQLEEQDHISDCRLAEQQDIAQYLEENISEILSGYE